MKIDNEFTVDAPIDRAWLALTDLEGIAPCMPGAQLTGVDDGVYTGKVKIKVGPVISQYAGTAEFVEKDESQHRAVIRAKGKDSRGAGNASAVIDARLRSEGNVTTVTVETDLNITGKIAQFGSGMIKEVSEKLLSQFVKNLESQLHTTPETPKPTTAPAGSPNREARTADVTTGGRQGAGAGDDVRAPTTTAVPTAESAAEPSVRAEPPAVSRRTFPHDDNIAPVDLLEVAGSSVYGRLLPVLAAVVVVIGVIVYLLAR